MEGEMVIEEHGAAAARTESAHETGIHVELAAEQLGTLWGIPVTNTLITSWAVILLLVIFAWWLGRRLSMVPGRMQTLVEEVFTFAQDFFAGALEDAQLARKFFPLLVTIFLFIFTANILEFTPGIGSITFDGAPLLRSVNTDLNVTLALTIIVVLVIELAGILTLGFFRYGSKFINFSSPVNFVVGLIELVSESARVVSFSFRLFGNIFAGEVLIGVVAFFVPYILPVPLMAFEMFVGAVQAAIFTLLTLFFIKLAVTDPHAEH